MRLCVKMKEFMGIIGLGWYEKVFKNMRLFFLVLQQGFWFNKLLGIYCDIDIYDYNDDGGIVIFR